MTVETARLIMRPWQADDLERVARLWADPVGVRYTWRQPPTPERVAAEADRILRCWQVHGFGPWAVIEKRSGAWIGKVGLDVLDDWPEDPKVEVGWVLDRAWWGQGLATEAAIASVHFAFDTLDMKRIISVTRPANTASRRVMEKTGLVYQGTRKWRRAQTVWYAADRDSWSKREPG
jgi:RimJ/RimL family protein N-acetyltransferase